MIMKDDDLKAPPNASSSSSILHPSSLLLDAPRYPARLRQRLGTATPPELTALGNPNLLSLPMAALFCSAHCPGKAILPLYDQVAKWRDEGQCVISGFHSPVEKECLGILLRGSQPIIICPARAIPKRIPQEWEKPLEENRLLILSFFGETETRITAELAKRRNKFVAALADSVFIAHAEPGGRIEPLLQKNGQP